jgi:hypothetical protein
MPRDVAVLPGLVHGVSGSLVYPACPQCLKKLLETGRGCLRCARCGIQPLPSDAVHRWRLLLRVQDTLGRVHRVVVFGSGVDSLMGINAQGYARWLTGLPSRCPRAAEALAAVDLVQRGMEALLVGQHLLFAVAWTPPSQPSQPQPSSAAAWLDWAQLRGHGGRAVVASHVAACAHDDGAGLMEGLDLYVRRLDKRLAQPGAAAEEAHTHTANHHPHPHMAEGEDDEGNDEGVHDDEDDVGDEDDVRDAGDTAGQPPSSAQDLLLVSAMHQPEAFSQSLNDESLLQASAQVAMAARPTSQTALKPPPGSAARSPTLLAQPYGAARPRRVLGLGPPAVPLHRPRPKGTEIQPPPALPHPPPGSVSPSSSALHRDDAPVAPDPPAAPDTADEPSNVNTPGSATPTPAQVLPSPSQTRLEQALWSTLSSGQRVYFPRVGIAPAFVSCRTTLSRPTTLRASSPSLG